MPPPDELPPVAGAKLAPDVTCAGTGPGSDARQRGARFFVARAAETPKPAPRWRAPLREPMQAPVPSGASLAPATGGGSSGGGIPVFLALPFLAAMLDLARRVTLDRVALPSGHRSRMPENPG